MISSRKFIFWTNSRHLDFTFAWYTMLINRKHRSGGESGWLDPRDGAVIPGRQTPDGQQMPAGHDLMT